MKDISEFIRKHGTAVASAGLREYARKLEPDAQHSLTFYLTLDLADDLERALEAEKRRLRV